MDMVNRGWVDRLRRCEHKKCDLWFLAHKSDPDKNPFHSQRCQLAAFRSTREYLDQLKERRATNAKTRSRNKKRGMAKAVGATR